MAFEHDIAHITAKIDVELPNGKKSIGTGFFYHVVYDDETNRGLLLLISNKHVFKDPKGKLTVSLNRRKEDGTPELGNIRTFNQAGFESIYYVHPNPDVDLACANVSGITRTDAFHIHLDHSLLKPIDYEKVALGSSVVFVGYPRGFYDDFNNLPLLRRGVIASVPNVDFQGKGEIVIDAHIFPGSSGSPVFVAWEGKYSLLGVVSEGVRGYSKLQSMPTKVPPVGVEQMIGLGIVVKQRHVQELIDYTVEEYIRRKSLSS
jgi:hypothetical protein